MKERSLPELLAPAGGFPQLRAAVQNGADAVYMGGSLFNARMRADNFNDEDMRRAVEYAHRRDVKLYVTLNTLIDDSELFKAFSYGEFLYSIGVDALIIQDLGLGRLFRKYLPDMPLHLSTQATVYNPQAVSAVKALGYSRVVPARELTLEEIRAFTTECHAGDTPCDVEVFVHGALCMCYSGQCQMSRLIGGANERSGNRGLCAQPCRLPYTDDQGRKGYWLSPKDLCLIDHIPELCQAGVDSFKIEGRLKSPEYVAVVTSIYRKYLDAYAKTGQVQVAGEDRRKLEQIFNRGGFTTGYVFGDPGRKLLSGSSPKNQGIYVGRVSAAKKGSVLIDVTTQPDEDIALGDGIEVRGIDTVGNLVTYRKQISRNVLRVGDLKRPVAAGDKVFRVTSGDLLREARASYEKDDRRRVPVSMEFRGYPGAVPALIMTCEGKKVQVMGKQPLEYAVKAPADRETVEAQLSKLGGTVYKAEKIRVRLGENVMIPKSVLNTLRREAADEMDARRLLLDRAPAGTSVLEQVAAEVGAGSGEEPLKLDRVPLLDFLDGKPGIPYLDPVTKGAMDTYIEENFEIIVEAVKSTGILVGNLGWIRRFCETGVTVYGDWGLNVYNEQSRKALRELGVAAACDSLERRQVLEADIPLMITEHSVDSETLTDRKGEVYKITPCQARDKYVISKA